MSDLPVYRVKFTGTEKAPAWSVVREDGTTVNSCSYASERVAKMWLERYVALNYCREAK